MNWFKRHHNYPEFYETYKATFKQKQNDLNNTRFVVFDTETTGLNPKSDRILSIGTIAIKKFQIDVSDYLECYLNQSVFNTKTAEIHGLLKQGTIEKIDETEAIKVFLIHIENAILVAHHAAFDVAMINEALKRMNLPKLKNKVIDTGLLYKKTKYIKEEKPYSLDDLCKMFNIPMHDRHTASGDAYLTGLLFLKLTSLLRKKKKRLILKDFFNWI